MTILLSSSQRAVADARSGHLLVDAGAGSGKTHTVVQTICHHLGVPVACAGDPLPPIANPLRLDQVGAITFTNQAAADLKRKLRASLRAAGRRDLAAEVDGALIGTIHSFCGTLLRDVALRAGMRPPRRILEEGEAAELAKECARQALFDALARESLPGLLQLLGGRRASDVLAWIASAASEVDRLHRWKENSAALREHEVALLYLAESAAALRVQRMHTDGAIDFDRMIVAVKELLEDEGVRSHLRQRIRLLVFDEFQDVDPAQRDIAFALGAVGDPEGRGTRLILVGDPKQSIYRFRRADVTVWNGVASRFRGGAGAVLPLADNYRSTAAILALVDFVMGPLLDKPVSAEGGRQDYEVDYASLMPMVSSAAEPAVEIITVPASERDGKCRNVAEVRAMEADAVASRIVALRARGVEYGDCAILLSGWGAVDTYERALQRAGIPCHVLRSDGFWQTREVVNCILALRAIRDGADDLALAGFLRSPFAGVRDDTLLALSLARNGGSLDGAMTLVQSEAALLREATSLLARFRTLRDRVGVDELLRRLLADSGYLAAVALDAVHGAQRLANIRKLLRMAAAVPHQSLGDFLRDVAAERARGGQEPQEKLHSERSEVVTITSVHSAKGLEWRNVFWCDLVRELPAESGAFLYSRDLFCVRDDSEVDESGEEGDASHAALREQLRCEQIAECYRLWYVAMTRARERLFLCGIPLGEMKKGQAISPARAVRNRFPTLGESTKVEYLDVRGNQFAADVASTSDAEAIADRVQPAAPELAHPLEQLKVDSGRSRLSATQLARFDAGATSGAGGPSEAHAQSGATVRPRGDSLKAGLMVHDILARAANGAELDELVDAAMETWADSDDGDDPDLADSDGSIVANRELVRSALRAAVEHRVRAAMSSPHWQILAAHPSARTELSFVRLLADGSRVEGAIDIAARVDDRVQILDVKSTREGDDEMLRRRYRVQAATYLDAMQAIAGAADASFALLTVPGGKMISVDSSADISSLVHELRSEPV